MDTIDFNIISELKRNGRISHESIAKKVGLSRPAVRQRILTMEESGILRSYTINIDYDLIGYSLNFFIYLKLNNTTFQEAANNIKLIKNEKVIMDSYYRLAGEWCVMLKVMSQSQKDLTNFIDEILNIDGIVASNSVFMFKS